MLLPILQVAQKSEESRIIQVTTLGQEIQVTSVREALDKFKLKHKPVSWRDGGNV